MKPEIRSAVAGDLRLAADIIEAGGNIDVLLGRPIPTEEDQPKETDNRMNAAYLNKSIDGKDILIIHCGYPQ
jgi:hypothetical protein